MAANATSSAAATASNGPPTRGRDFSLFSSAGRSLSSLAANILSQLPPFPDPGPTTHAASFLPRSSAAMVVPFLLPSVPSSSAVSCHRSRSQDAGSPSASIRSFTSGVRIEGISSAKSGGGPAFVGQVFSMLDPSGNGLMAVTTRFDIPFLSKRTPEWIKKMLAAITKNDQKGPVFRFFMDLSDAVMYVKNLNVPTGMVGACRLDVAYEHFKEKPHMFQFVPNKKQVKAANDIIKQIGRKHGRRVNGVPVFTAHNLNIAIATNDGIKWYTPYFFDKAFLDNILEASVDQHFHAMIQNRHMQRRQDVIDDSMTGEMFEEYNDSFFEPPEVQEALDEMGQFGIPLNIVSKAAEIQLLDVVDKVLLGNKWLRKATGIQPKFPYLVDSFEERTAASFSKVALVANNAANTEDADKELPNLQVNPSEFGSGRSLNGYDAPSQLPANTQFPIADWFMNPWSRQNQVQENSNKVKSEGRSNRDTVQEVPSNPLLPKITMVGISMSEGSQVTKANLKKTMEDLSRELEQANQQSRAIEDKDPLFIANVGDYSSMMRVSSS